MKNQRNQGGQEARRNHGRKQRSKKEQSSAQRAADKSLRAIPFHPQDYKLVSLRECPFREDRPLLETPAQAAEYWRQHVATEVRFNPHTESLVVLMVNGRCRLLGHLVLSQGTKDTVLLNTGEALRPAVIANAAAVVLMHNHPSGDPSPSEADIKVTRELQRAGNLLKVRVMDHVIMGRPSRESGRDYVSLNELGYFEDPAKAPAMGKAADRPAKAKPAREYVPSKKGGWVPAEKSGIRNPEAGRSVIIEGGTLRHTKEDGYFLFHKRRTTKVNGKPGDTPEVLFLLNEALRNPASQGTIKLTFTYGRERAMVKRLTRREAVQWAVEGRLPECFHGDVVLKASRGKGEVAP